MSDVRPKRPARSETAPGDLPSPATAAAIIAATGAASAPAETIPFATAEPIAEPEPPILSAAAEPVAAAAEDAWTALAAAQTALARGFEEVAAEMNGIARSGVAASTDAALALLGARTFAEAVEINASLARRRFDAMVEGSARLSDIGVKAITEASRPFLPRLGAG